MTTRCLPSTRSGASSPTFPRRADVPPPPSPPLASFGLSPQGLRADSKAESFVPYTDGCLRLLMTVSKLTEDHQVDDSLIRASVGVVGDLASTLGSRFKQQVRLPLPHLLAPHPSPSGAFLSLSSLAPPIAPPIAPPVAPPIAPPVAPPRCAPSRTRRPSPRCCARPKSRTTHRPSRSRPGRRR